jgi:hypothetical protein
MTDVGSHHFVKGGSHVLVPQPSDDPHDPLNWSPKWKGMCIIASTMVSFTQGFGPLALAPMIPYYIEDFDSDLEAVRTQITLAELSHTPVCLLTPELQVIDFTGVVILVLGFSNFIW